MSSIEQSLIDAVQRRSMAFVLQDLVCSKCHQVRAGARRRGRGEDGYDDVGYCYHCIMWISGSSCLVVAAVPIPMKSMLN